jgi:hypothetical protein
MGAVEKSLDWCLRRRAERESRQDGQEQKEGKRGRAESARSRLRSSGKGCTHDRRG